MDGDPDYHLALGQFVDQFATVERYMAGLLTYHADLGAAESAALISGVRAKEGASLINRLLEAKGRLEVKDRLEPVFCQLGHLIDARNAILHHGVHKWMVGGMGVKK